MLSMLLIVIFYVLLVFVTVRSRRKAISYMNKKLSLAGTEAEPKPEPIIEVPSSSERIVGRLREAFAECVILPSQADTFDALAGDYFSQQSTTTKPLCIVRPGSVTQLSEAVAILHEEFVARRRGSHDKDGDPGFIAVRSGGHSYARASASIDGGVLVDLSLFSEVAISDDGSSVAVGTGARWNKVYQVLEAKKLAVPGGRNAAVGVGGFTLGGGISFFSQGHGLACSNVIEYEVVLASGEVVTASATSNPKLWRALKGGGSNFGIVTRFTFRTFACGDIWGGWLFSPGFERSKVIKLFHGFLDKARPSKVDANYDDHASGPMVCFCYVQRPGMEIISTFLAYTKTMPSGSGWPKCWEKSGFKSIWRYWSTLKQRTLSGTCQDLAFSDEPGLSQNIAGTVVKNDKATLEAAYMIYRDACTEVNNVKGKGIRFVFVMQPLLPDWMHKGDPNYLGLEETFNEPHVSLSFSPVWNDINHNEFVESLVRRCIEKIESFARDHGTHHPYKYVNYCAAWQKPFDGYSEENLEIMRQISKQYDSEGFFQHGCTGGFKLPDADGS